MKTNQFPIDWRTRLNRLRRRFLIKLKSSIALFLRPFFDVGAAFLLAAGYASAFERTRILGIALGIFGLLFLMACSIWGMNIQIGTHQFEASEVGSLGNFMNAIKNGLKKGGVCKRPPYTLRDFFNENPHHKMLKHLYEGGKMPLFDELVQTLPDYAIDQLIRKLLDDFCSPACYDIIAAVLNATEHVPSPELMEELSMNAGLSPMLEQAMEKAKRRSCLRVDSCPGFAETSINPRTVGD